MAKKKTLIFLITSLFISSAFAFSALCSQTSSRISASGVIDYNLGTLQKLHTEGRWIKNEDGAIVYLAGVRFHATEHNKDGHFGPDPISESWFEGMKNWGCTCISVSVEIGWYDTDEEYRNTIDMIIGWAKARGMYVVLQNYFPDGPGTWGDTVQARRVLTMEASRYGDGNVLIQLIDEPTAPSLDIYITFVEQCITDIRAVAPDMLIVINKNGPNRPDLQEFENYPESILNAGNLIIAPHIYRYHHGVPETYDEIEAYLIDYGWRTVLDTLNLPILVAECGWFRSGGVEQELKSLRNQLTIFQEWDLGFIGHAWGVEGYYPDYGALLSAFPHIPNEGGEIIREFLLEIE